ncbi:MAG: DegV family protein [Lachnospiraceae bacterium]|nr:DegV family protein [Lachnospiraceae bacterium]MDD3615759.1 DegV family protein [Lachnospiraceae bacterium]
MREFVITTESNSDLPVEYLEENGIEVIPHYYNVENQVYGGERHLSNHEFYNEMRREKTVGTTASNPAVIEEVFERYARKNMDVLHISFSSALSSGYNNVMVEAKLLREDFPMMRIEVFDTLNVSLGEGLFIMKAVNLKKEGKSIDEIVKLLTKLRSHVHTLFTVEDLKYLYRGGRITRSSQILGNVMQLKPIIHVDSDGKLTALTKIRGRKKSMVTLVDYMEESMGRFQNLQEMIGVVHGDCEQEANNLATMIKARFGYEYVLVCPIGPSIGAHSGPGAVGIIYLGEEK